MRAQQSWSRAARVSDESQANVEATVARAFALGINHFETARGYGTSEAQLGRALRAYPRERFILQTKVRPHEDPKAFEEQLEESFSLLGVRRVDLFAFHGLNSPRDVELTLRAGGCWEVADRLRRAGRIGHLGFSTHAPLPLILDAVATGRFDYVNLHYYYIFQDNLPAVRAARARDMGVFIISPTDKGGRLYAAPERLRALTAPLSPLVFNELWCLAQTEVHTLSLGAARPSDFDEHMQTLPLLAGDGENGNASGGAGELGRTLLSSIVVKLEKAYRDAVGEDFARRWHEGLPDWQQLPGRINVRRILWLYNLVRAYDLVDFAQERYASLDPGSHWVPGARAADFGDAEMAAALPASPFRAEIPALLRRAHQVLWDPTVRPRP